MGRGRIPKGLSCRSAALAALFLRARILLPSPSLRSLAHPDLTPFRVVLRSPDPLVSALLLFRPLQGHPPADDLLEASLEPAFSTFTWHGGSSSRTGWPAPSAPSSWRWGRPSWRGGCSWWGQYQAVRGQRIKGRFRSHRLSCLNQSVPPRLPHVRDGSDCLPVSPRYGGQAVSLPTS